jgi:phosphoenolpyruvate phosphomutase
MKIAIAAHNGFTARIVSQFDFDFVWASSLEISSSHALPDASIISFETTKRIVENMVESSFKPILVDCDSGYGNAINTIFAMKELKKIGVKAVCIEDNVFPKQNSFYKGSRNLEDAEVFARKVYAAKSVFSDPGDIVIARSEALIQGLGVEEALRRAKLYELAGADYIMPHSKSTSSDELFTFSDQWESDIPLVSVPSTYFNVTRTELAAHKVGLVIYANHTIRAVKKTLESLIPKLLDEDSSVSIESEISPISEILHISGESHIKKMEKDYL